MQTQVVAADIMITKEMAEKCAQFKGQKAKYRDCLVRQGAQAKGHIDKNPAVKLISSASVPIDKNSGVHEIAPTDENALTATRFSNLKPLHIEDTTFDMFTGGSDGRCNHIVPVRVYCSDSLCLVWQKSSMKPEPTSGKMAKVLRLLEQYIAFGTDILNYTPSLNALPNKVFTGTDGISRRWTIEVADYFCHPYGGASYNGVAWNALPKDMMSRLIDTIDDARPIMPQVALYEMGRSMYDLRLDNILDWQMEAEDKYGYWTLGLNGALTVLAPEALNLKMAYAGYDDYLAQFRRDRLNDINTYINDRQWNFDNAWSVWLLPWAPRQSINDMMTGLILLLTDRFGGAPYLKELTKNLLDQPTTANKTDRKARAINLYRAARQAADNLNGNGAAVERFFKHTLRWRNFLPR